MKTILIGAYYQILTFLRIKKAVFFSFFFPSFIYIIFSLTWGWDDEDYNLYLLTGVIGITIVSDSLFSIGNVVVEYYYNGLMKFFKCLPYKFLFHLVSLFISRILIVSLSILIVITVSVIFGNIKFNKLILFNYIIGIFIGLFLFSIIGIIVAMLTKDYVGNSTVQNFILFAIIFLSNAFYPLSELNSNFVNIVRFNPISPILQIIRGEVISFPTLYVWLSIILIIVYILKRQQIKR